MKIHLQRTDESRPVATSQRMVAPGSIFGGWKLGRLLTPRASAEPLLCYRAAPAATPENCDYLLHTPADPNSKIAYSLLQAEWRLSQNLSSPHVLPVLDLQLDGTPYFVVTPRLTGSTLRSLLRHRGRLDLCHAIWMLRQAAQAVAALHRHGWSMPRLQTEKMIVGPDGHLTLAAVGHARPIRKELDASMQIHADTCRLVGIFFEMIAGDFQDGIEDTGEESQGSMDLTHCRAASVRTLLTEMLNPSNACNKHSARFLVENLVRFEIDLLSRVA